MCFFKRYLFCTLSFISSLLCCAQSWDEIKGSGLYYYGEGWAETIDEANQQALSMLIQQIKVNVSTNTNLNNKREEKKGKVVSDNNIFQAVINSYSQATLEGTNMLVIDPAPHAHVGRWIRKSELSNIFAGRRHKIHELIDAADRAIEKGKIDVALKSYYWAFTLVKSMQKCNDETYNGHTLMSWLPEQINDVLSDIKCSVGSINDGDIELNFAYKNKPVNSLDFSYNDGGFWSNLCSAKDGKASIYLSPGTIANELQIEIEFEYRGQSMLDPEIQSILAVIPEVKMGKALLTVNCQPTNVVQSPITTDSSASFTDVEPQFFQKPRPLSNGVDQYETILEKVTNAIQSKNYSQVRQYFTESGYGTFTRLINYGSAKIIGSPHFTFNRVGHDICGRGLQMSFTFRNSARKSFTEDIVFTINSESNLISNIAFGLGKTTEDDILGNKAYPEDARWLLIQFMENYQTAFALKRLDYIKTIFDDDAIIIVGKEVKRVTSHQQDGIHWSDDKIIQYNRYSKDAYLKRLEQSFSSKEFINLRFNSTNVKRANVGGEIYGIQLEQDYYSSNYGDHGFLFLELNMNNPNQPLILVRTWQPNPDPNFGVYDISDFPIQHFDD